MEATEERRTFDKVIKKLSWLGSSLKSALYFGGLDTNSLNRMKATVEELNQLEVSDFIGSWLKMPENNSLLEVWVNDILGTYNYSREVEKANFKPQQIGENWVNIAENYDAWRNTIIWNLAKCLPDGAAKIYEGKEYVIFPNVKSKVNSKVVDSKQDLSFRDCIMIEDKDGLLGKLHKIIGNKRGKAVAMAISFCVKNGIISKPTYTIIKNEFGDIGAKSGFNKYMASFLEEVKRNSAQTTALEEGERKSMETAFKDYL